MTEITEAKEDPPSGRHFRTFGHGSFGGCCQLEKVCLDGESILLLPRTAHSENPLALSQTLSLYLYSSHDNHSIFVFLSRQSQSEVQSFAQPFSLFLFSHSVCLSPKSYKA